MANSTLEAIRVKVRRLTRSPSTSQLSNEQIDEYINTYLLYDFPQELRLFSLRTTLTFYTQPYVDTYETSTNINDPLFNFKNKYTAVHPPVFLAGVQGFYTQWRDVFYANYPQTRFIAKTGLVGNGTTGPFEGRISSAPVLQRNVLITCLDILNEAMIVVDDPVTNTLGNLTSPTDPTVDYGVIDYTTGEFTVTFPLATKVGAPIESETISYRPGKPVAMLFYDNKFTLRPVPDKAYPIQVEVDARPTELLESNQEPQLSQWWQLIAYGAAKKVFEDRMDIESIQMIMPELNHQERLCLRSTLTQQANERTVTIYTQGRSYYNWGGWGSWPY